MKIWDWLMPVVDKIERLGYSPSVFPSGLTVYQKGELVCKNDYSGERSMLENIYNGVVKFINWYNTQEKK